MLRLLVKFIILSVIVFLCSTFIKKALDMPYSWSTDYELARSVTLSKEPEKYNTIFIGSSKTFRGVNPLVFDRFLKENSKVRTTSFNYGLGGSTAGQLYGLCRNLIQKKADGDLPNLKYLFHEIRSVQTSTIDNLFMKNLHSSRERIWINDKKALNFSWKTYWDLKDPDRYSTWKKIKFSFYFFVKYISYKFNVGEVKDMIVKKNYQSKIDLDILGKEGFVPMETTKGKKNRRRHKEYVRDSIRHIKVSRKRSELAFESKKPIGDKFQNPEYAAQLTELVELAAEQGITLIFVTHPMLRKEDYPQQKTVFDNLPPKNRIQLTSAKDYPELYDSRNYYDDTHTTGKGATALTERLAQQFLHLKRVKVKVSAQK